MSRRHPDQPRGYWDIVEVDPPRSLVFRDGFANDDGSPNPDLPLTTARVTIEEMGSGRTRMSIESLFPSTKAMEQVLAMGTGGFGTLSQHFSDRTVVTYDPRGVEPA